MARVLPALLAAAALAALPCLPVLAGDGDKAPAKAGKGADGKGDKGAKGQDKDAALEAAENLKTILDGFATLDADADGKLSKAELGESELIEGLDGDGDGALSREEVGRGLKLMIAAAGVKPPMKGGPAEGEKFSDWAKRRVATDPRFNAEARRDQLLSGFDANKDGKVQRKEYASADGDRIFRDFDVVRDGALDERETLLLAKDQLADLEKARRRPNRYNFLVLFDLDDDRNVTKDEYAFLRGPASTFNSYDDDNDGIVTYDELYNVGNSKDRRMRGKMVETTAEAPPEKKDVWGLYDKNKDGRVTEEEFAGGEAVFRRLDKNRDGSLTAADV
jgi:Ca2+-binding EF-hand superfamily protein